MADQVIAMSLSLKGAREMKRIRPDWKVGLLSSVAVGDLALADGLPQSPEDAPFWRPKWTGHARLY